MATKLGINDQKIKVWKLQIILPPKRSPPTWPNIVRQADITNVETNADWLYMMGILDRCTCRCVDWAMGDY